MRHDEIIPVPEQLRFKIEKICARHAINPETLRLARFPQDELEATIIECVRKVCYIPAVPVISYPADWWQAVKERWFPRWALERWPVVYKRHEARAMFPALHVPNRDQFVHYFTWFTEGPP